METITGAFIYIGMRATIYEQPLERDRGHAIRGRPCGGALNVSIAVLPSIVVNKPHASGPTIGLLMTELRPGIRGSSTEASQHEIEFRQSSSLRAGAGNVSVPNS